MWDADRLSGDAAPAERLAFLEALVAALPFGIAVSDAEGRPVYANEAARILRRREGLASVRNADEQAQDNLTIETRKTLLKSDDGAFSLETLLDVTAQRTLERELFDRAYLDDLTGLPNRSLLHQSAQDLIETLPAGCRFALGFVDIDNFKHINDYYSHAVGDALLVKIGARLSSMVRPGNLVGRVGGDEFILLIDPVASIAELQADIDAIANRLKQPFFIEGHEIFASASVGVSVFPDHGRSYDALRRNADNAMYRAKSGVKGGALLFEQSMAHAATARMASEQRLRLAIRDQRFCCAFQPKVDIRTQDVVGLEVLLRWRDDRGIINAPGDFVGLAVELGLIDEISYLVLAETMRLLDEIDAAFGPKTTISLNVAAKQAEDTHFMQGYVAALNDTGCPARFMIEVTEEAFFAKTKFQDEVLPQLRAIGTRVSIDDFGVGYSSLAALADISADELKIDRSFIRDIHNRPRSQHVLRAIESLSKSLGMSVIAEGVETAEELAYLETASGIVYAQGYYFAKPMLLEGVAGSTAGVLERHRGTARDGGWTREQPGRVGLAPGRG